MTAMTLLIDQRNTQLALKPNRVVEVRHANGETYRVGLKCLRRILVQGDADLSSSLLRTCHLEGVPVILTSGRGKGEPAHLFPANFRGVKIRHAQHCCHADPARRLELAKRLVKAKIEQQCYWLEQYGQAVATVSRFIEAADSASSLETLMGVEGAAAARYFSLWGEQWPTEWQFNGRNRRPPRDPVNSLISLGYALATNRLGQMAVSKGMDPGMGFLHGPLNDRPSLALDLLEPVRPWVDRWVWLLAQRGEINPQHFSYSAGEGCRLDKAGRDLFFRIWHQEEDHWLPQNGRKVLSLILAALREDGIEEEPEDGDEVIYLPGRSTNTTSPLMPSGE